MSIRFRLLIMCVIATILPAIPITYLVRDLLDKSFDVGLSSTMSDALESGMSVSRKYLVRLQSEFEKDVQGIIAHIPPTYADPSRVDAVFEQYADENGTIGYFVASPEDSMYAESREGSLPPALEVFAFQPEFTALIETRSVSPRPGHANNRDTLAYFETEDKAVQLALWKPASADDGGLLFYREIDPEFLASAQRLVHGRQIFAQLRLAQGALSHSFFYPFIIVYGVILLLALLLALFVAERMATPVRNLAEASEAVAGGNWQIQLRRTIGGEIGRLIDSFNLMVSRLDSQRRRLLDMEKVMGWREMARHLAHEIKNPLLPIRLAVQEMRDQYRGDDKAYGEFLDESTRVVEDELGHLQRLVREFSMFAKLPGLSPTTGSLERLLSDLAKLYPQVETHISADPTVPEFPFDQDQMRRVFVNLFDNARSVSRIENATKISIELKRSESDAVIIFSDNGPGIPAEYINRVFDPYFTTRRTGTGLGLALVKSIVLMHQGTIYVESPPGRGATFTMVLPLSGPGNNEAPQEER
ncbi:HAMP domain-containing histidine kinase [bacterium]|nr:HAMP domain-containing histidine kinase [bacterium]